MCDCPFKDLDPEDFLTNLDLPPDLTFELESLREEIDHHEDRIGGNSSWISGLDEQIKSLMRELKRRGHLTGKEDFYE